MVGENQFSAEHIGGLKIRYLNNTKEGLIIGVVASCLLAKG